MRPHRVQRTKDCRLFSNNTRDDLAPQRLHSTKGRSLGIGSGALKWTDGLPRPPSHQGQNKRSYHTPPEVAKVCTRSNKKVQQCVKQRTRHQRQNGPRDVSSSDKEDDRHGSDNEEVDPSAENDGLGEYAKVAHRPVIPFVYRKGDSKCILVNSTVVRRWNRA